MQPSEQIRFRAVMAGMSKLYERELDSVLLDAYWLALRDWSLDDFEAAAAHLMKTSTFMPRPADFEKLRRAGEMTAQEAWLKVLSGSLLDHDSVAERAAKVCGGQQQIRLANIEKDLPHIQRRFMDAYEAISDAEKTRKSVPLIAKPDWLAGTAERLRIAK